MPELNFTADAIRRTLALVTPAEQMVLTPHEVQRVIRHVNGTASVLDDREVGILEEVTGGPICLGPLPLVGDERTLTELGSLAWCNTLARFTAFVAEHGRPPARSESDGQPRPHLGQWYSHLRNGRGVPPERAAALDEVWPDWWKPYDTFPGALARFTAFVTAHGRPPKESESDGHPGPHLGKWYSRLRKGEGVTPERAAALDVVWPDWRKQNFYPFSDTLARFTAFVTEHGRPPKISESDGQPGPHLGQWYSRLRNGKSVTPERAAALDAVWPDWRKPYDPFPDALARFTVFVAEHGRPPKDRESDGQPGPHLGQWYRNLRKRQGVTPERAAALDAVWPDWRGLKQKRKTYPFSDTLARFTAFVTEHGRPPKDRESDGQPGPHLGQWYRSLRSGRGVTPERAAALDAVWPDWRGPKLLRESARS